MQFQMHLALEGVSKVDNAEFTTSLVLFPSVGCHVTRCLSAHELCPTAGRKPRLLIELK